MLAFYLAIIDTQEDRDLFTSLYKQYKGFIYSIANKILEDHHSSENIVHDTFIRMIDNLEKFNLKNGHKTKTLIGIIADGLAKNEYNRRKRVSSLEEESDEMLADSTCTDEAVIQADQYEIMLGVLKQLDPIYRNAFRLKYDFQYSTKEIASLTGVSEDTVRQRLHRAKLKLQKILVKEGQLQ